MGSNYTAWFTNTSDELSKFISGRWYLFLFSGRFPLAVLSHHCIDDPCQFWVHTRISVLLLQTLFQVDKHFYFTLIRGRIGRIEQLFDRHVQIWTLLASAISLLTLLLPGVFPSYWILPLKFPRHRKSLGRLSPIKKPRKIYHRSWQL